MSNLRQKGVDKTEDNKSRYPLRIDREPLDKQGSLAEWEGRTKNGQLVHMIRRRIAAFEKEHGPIEAK